MLMFFGVLVLYFRKKLLDLKGRDEKDTEKKPPSEATAIQPLKSIRKRISPPPAAPRDDLRRDHVDSRFVTD